MFDRIICERKFFVFLLTRFELMLLRYLNSTTRTVSRALDY